jgi:hypothetical protein
MKRAVVVVALLVALAACADETPAPAKPSAFISSGAATSTPTITVTSADGPVPHCFVEVSRGDERIDWKQSGDDGTARFESLDVARRYRLAVAPPKERDDLLPEELDAWTPSDTVVRLALERTISGRIVDAAGRPYPAAGVFIRGDETVRLRARSSVDSEGRFVVKGLREGQQIELASTDRPAVLKAIEEGREPYHPGVWTLHKAGEKDVVITVELP